MTWFKDNIWTKFFHEYHKANDTYKVNGKGLSQRFMEMLGNYLDTEVLPPIDDLLPNTTVVASMIPNLLPYREQERGVDLVYDNTLVRRKQILQYFIRISQLKGSKRGYEVCFKLMAFEHLIIEYVDVITYFDNPIPSAGCNACYEYDVVIQGSLLLLEPFHVDAFFNVVAYNEPINCKIRFMIYNDFYLVKDFVTFFFDDPKPYNYATLGKDANLYIDNSRNPTFSGSFVDAEGNLYLNGSDKQYYELDELYFGNMGQMIFRKPQPNTYTFFSALLPTNVTATSFTANWQTKSGAVRYFLSVGLSRANDNQVIKQKVVDSLELNSSITSHTVTGLNPNTTYYYQVVAENAQGQKALSSVQSLITLRFVEAPVALPPNEITSYYFMATWQRVAEATAYELDVSDDINFNVNVQTFALRNIHQYIVYRGTGTWYYRVRAKVDRYSGIFFITPVSISGNSNVIEVGIVNAMRNHTDDYTDDYL